MPAEVGTMPKQLVAQVLLHVSGAIAHPRHRVDHIGSDVEAIHGD